MIIGRCVRCGREFMTLPADMKDHYTRKGPYRGETKVCNGRVEQVPRSPEASQASAHSKARDYK